MLHADGVAPQETQLVQAVRSVNKDQAPSSIAPAQPDEIFYVDCHTDPETLRPVVLWDDILQAFDNAVRIRDKARVVPFLKGGDLRKYVIKDSVSMLCNNGQNITVLDVVVSSPSVDTKIASSLPGSMQEEVKEMWSDKDVVASQSTATPSTSTVRRRSVYGLENITMENYNHIDKPPSPRWATTDFSTRRNPVWSLESAAMDNYSHIDNLAFAPPLREPQAVVDDQSPIDKNLPALPHSNHNAKPPLRAPQSATTDVPIEKDLTQLSISASLGDMSAQVALGNMYADGEGVLQDYQSAMDWYLKAANQGDPIGQRRVGFLYHRGLGISRSYSTALEWFIKAADQGDADAQYSVGVMYDRGDGVPQDFAKAMEWYRISANQEHARTQHNIGLMYDVGKGVPQDFAKAMEWYLKAADQGLPAAQHNIGLMCDVGKGVPQDFCKAMDWYRMAADKGDAGAQCKIGIMNIKGQGVTKSYSEARKYFQKTADQGHPDAHNWLKELSTIGSDKQIVAKTTKKKGVFSRLFK
ncbi:hypothetical protein EC957_004393 [Mortierella hygrophila]|uniref:HCP-like protein n=1 Tax=Mortierella hygrophila TaxID=979708 RepID=A0A9P6F2C4_9FUNG|nr:hypothetical protein EC957_004393 [Mortierella hygrophila]